MAKTADVQTRIDVLVATAGRQFPDWTVEHGSDKTDTWVKLTQGDNTLQVKVSHDIPLRLFEAATWTAMKQEKDRFLLTGEGND